MTIVHNLRQHNRERVLRLLADGSSLSRPDIAQNLGLSKVTTTSIVNALVEEQLLAETAKLSSGTGRPAGLVELHAQAGTVAGIDVQPHALTLISGNLTATDHSHRVSKPLDAARPITDHILETLESLRLSQPHGSLRHVVLGLPAPITPEGEPGTPSRLPALETNRLRGWGEQHDVDISFENDVNLAAVAEFEIGAASGQQDFALLSERDDGVALGLYLGGQLYRGDGGRAGEVALIGWPQSDTVSSIEELPVGVRELALAQVCSAVSVVLDLSLLLIHQSAGGAAALDVAARVRQFVLRPLEVRHSHHGDQGTTRGALLLAARRAQDKLFCGI